MLTIKSMDGRARTVTIRDVARRAGVSKSTVSKFLTGTPYVSADTAALIERAIDELGYEPNAVARSLTTGRTGFIGVIVASILNPFYTQLVQAIDDEAAALDLTVMLATSDRDPQREHKIVQGLRQKGVDGLLFASVHMADREVIELKRSGLPVVLASRHLIDVDVDYVIVDSARGARLAVEHLLALGHQRIAHVAGPPSILQFVERKRGWRDALHEGGVPPSGDLLVESPPTLEAGREAFRRLWALPAGRRPSAIFAATDFLALGVVAEARAAGVAVPGRLSVVGFDNVFMAEVAAVPLTTVDSQIDRLGRDATRLLAERMGEPQPGAHQHEVLVPSLVTRESTAPPPVG